MTHIDSIIPVIPRSNNPTGKATHGKSNTSVYRRWKAMRRRCLNPATDDYKNYGGRGIKICERWDKFENFYADMGDPPAGMTLERRDTNGDYCPDNCYWASWTDQMNNRRNSIFLTLNGRTQTLPMWSREIHIKQSTLLRRHNKGWSDEKVLTTPLNISKRNTLCG